MSTSQTQRGLRKCLLSLCLIILSSSYGLNSAWAADKKSEPEQLSILGWVESVYLEPWGFKFRARLDTGAKTSSISARDIVKYEKDDKPWVRFVFDFKEDKGKPNRQVTIERPIYRFIKIKRHNNKIQHRPVVMLEICINGEMQKGQFSLIDRRSLNYPMLLGRRLLKDVALVDSGHSFLGNTKCKAAHKKSKKKKTDAKKPKD